MMDSKMAAGAAALLAAGAAAGWLAATALRPAPEAGDADGGAETHRAAKVVKVGTGDGAASDALRRRVKDLEKRLAEAERSAERENADAEPARIGPMGDRRNWLANLEKEDPVRFAEVTNRMAAARARRRERAASQFDFLSSIDTSAMDADDAETHARLLELIAKREELIGYMEDGAAGGLSREKMRERGRAMHELMGEIAELSAKERDMLVRQTMQDLGFDGDDADEISAAIREVVESTSGAFGGPPHGPGGPGGGPGGPGGGPRGRRGAD